MGVRVYLSILWLPHKVVVVPTEEGWSLPWRPYEGCGFQSTAENIIRHDLGIKYLEVRPQFMQVVTQDRPVVSVHYSSYNGGNRHHLTLPDGAKWIFPYNLPDEIDPVSAHFITSRLSLDVEPHLHLPNLAARSGPLERK
jgi:hypothetical protein